MNEQLYRLAYGGPNPETRDFPVAKMNDAVTRFSDKVIELDRNPDVHAAWVTITLILPENQMTLLAWTKTSDECPTIEGELKTDIFK